MKRIADFFLQNVGWKLLSLVLAAVLWFVGTNVTDPTQDKRYTVSLTVLNKENVEQNNLVLLNEDELQSTQISIRVRAAKSVLERLSNEKSEIKAYIDLKPIDVSYADKVGEPQSVSVRVDMPSYIADDGIISKDPPTAQILLDNYVEKTIPITVEPVGTPAESYLSMTPMISPDKITVRGAKTEVDQIVSARVQVDLQDATTTIQKQTNIVIMDRNRTDVTNEFDIDEKRAQVTVEIYKYKSVSLRPTYTGNLATGYRLASTAVEPDTVQVVGNEEELDALTEIVLTPAVNLDGAFMDVTKRYDIRQLLIDKKTNLSIRNNTPHEVTVTVYVEKETIKELIVPIEMLDVKGIDYDVDLPSEVNLVVRGAAADVEALMPDNVEGTIDLTGLEPGEHEVTVNFHLPKNVVQLGDPASVLVMITEPMETAEPEQ